ncbi:MAG: hypothetical protein WAO21_09825 [Verrucomicrobiia bacterium]|jgi:hypothetical protein
MKQEQRRIQLDRSKLLGFRLAQSTPAENAGTNPQAKLGAKFGAKLGGKAGAKIGAKPGIKAAGRL